MPLLPGLEGKIGDFLETLKKRKIDSNKNKETYQLLKV